MNLFRLRPSAISSIAIPIVLGAALILTSCTKDADPVAGSSVAITTTVDVEPTVATTIAETTTTPATTVPPTTVESTTTTTEPPPPGWTPVDALPSLAYPPCCGSNWFGAASPAIPTDPNVGLAPGIYYASRIAGDASTESISFEVSRFEACTKLPAGACEDGPYGVDDMGIEPAIRGFTLPLDATIRVGVSGYECEADQQTATAAELRPLMVDFDRSYNQLLGGPFEEGESPETLVAALSDTPSGGFAAPNCPELEAAPGALFWQGDEGPPILMQTQFAYDNVGDPSVPASASSEWIRLTAIEIGPDGTPTLYFFAGFMS